MQLDRSSGRNHLLVSLAALAGALVVVFLYLSAPVTESVGDVSGDFLLIEAPECLSTDSIAGYYSYAIAEELINQLVRQSSVPVFAPRTTAMLRYGGEQMESARRVINPRFILRSFLSTRGSDISLDMMLVDTTKPSPIWSSLIIKPIRELQDPIAQIADTIRAFTSAGRPEVLDRGPVWKGDSFAWYLFGRFVLVRPDIYNIADALIAFQRSLQEDPDVPDSHIALASTLLMDYEARESFAPYHVESALIHVKEAQALGSRTAELVRTLGLIDMYSGRFGEARDHLEESVEIAPLDAESLRRLADLSLLTGDHTRAVSVAEYAVKLDPLNERSFVTLGRIHEFKREQADALKWYIRGAEVARDRQGYLEARLPEVLAGGGEPDSALAILSGMKEDPLVLYRIGRICDESDLEDSLREEAFIRAEDLLTHRLDAVPNDLIARGYRALIFARTGRKLEGIDDLEKIDSEKNPHPHILYLFARFHALAGEPEKAAGYLARALTRKYDPDQLLDPDLAVFRGGKELLEPGGP